MRGDLERRLRAVERKGSGGFEVWFEEDNGTFDVDGKQMTWEDAQALWRATGRSPVVIRKHDAGV